MPERDYRAACGSTPEMTDKGRKIIGPDQGVGIQSDKNRVGMAVVQAGQGEIETYLAGKPHPSALGGQLPSR